MDILRIPNTKGAYAGGRLSMQELRRKGMTLALLWEECKAVHALGYHNTAVFASVIGNSRASWD
ncbi:hypothetical protein DFAR_1760014 [Desulfarculales bacterium]